MSKAKTLTEKNIKNSSDTAYQKLRIFLRDFSVQNFKEREDYVQEIKKRTAEEVQHDIKHNFSSIFPKTHGRYYFLYSPQTLDFNPFFRLHTKFAIPKKKNYIYFYALLNYLSLPTQTTVTLQDFTGKLEGTDFNFNFNFNDDDSEIENGHYTQVRNLLIQCEKLGILKKENAKEYSLSKITSGFLLNSVKEYKQDLINFLFFFSFYSPLGSLADRILLWHLHKLLNI